MSHYHFTHPEGHDLQAAWSVAQNPQQNWEIAMQHGRLPLEVAHSYQEMATTSQTMAGSLDGPYGDWAQSSRYASNFVPQDLGRGHDYNSNAHYPTSQPERPFRHSSYEQFSRHDNSQPNAELPNQLGFTQGVEDEDMDSVDSRSYDEDDDPADDMDEDGYVGGHEDSSSDYSSESDEEVEHQQTLPSIRAVLEETDNYRTSSVLEARMVDDSRFGLLPQQAMPNMAHDVTQFGTQSPGRGHSGISPPLEQTFQFGVPQEPAPTVITRQTPSGVEHTGNGAPVLTFAAGPSNQAEIKLGRKRFGSPLSSASNADQGARHVSKKYKQVPEPILASSPALSRVQMSGSNGSASSGTASPALTLGASRAGPSHAGMSRGGLSHAGPSHAGPSTARGTPPLSPENPYAIPASRGEITEIRRILDGLITAVRDLSATCSRLATAREPERPQAGSTGVHAGPPPVEMVSQERFEAKRKGAPVRRSDDELTLSANVQDFARTLLNRETADSPFDPTTLATPREVKRWKKSKRGEFCCTSESFRIDINSGALNEWNRSAAVVFADAFVQSGYYDCEDQDLIAEAFMTHLRTLRKKYRERDRTTEEVEDSQKKGRRDQRKEKLFQRRRRTALKNPELAPHVPMLEKFGVDGMSSDESVRENGEVRYRILKKSWRPDGVTRWLAGFDAVDAITRGKRGRKPHKRVVSTKIDDSRPPVRGLPKNAYNPAWYATIGPFDRTMLHRAQTDYSFNHCNAVQVVLNEYTRQINNPAQYR